MLRKKKLEARLLGTMKKGNANDADADEIENDDIDKDDDDGSIDELEDNDSTTSEESNQNNALGDSLMELLTVLVDEQTLKEFGWPDVEVDQLIEFVIKRCGHTPVAAENASYITRLRENSKQLFSIIIDDSAIKTLLSNQSIEEVIEHVLKLAKA